MNAPPHEVLDLAQKAGNGRDVRIGGGPSVVRQFLQADLIDFMHLAMVPITLGRGVSLWEGLRGLEDRFTIETLTSPSGITHQLWNKRDERSGHHVSRARRGRRAPSLGSHPAPLVW